MDPEIAQFLEFIEESLDTILSCVGNLSDEQLLWKPDAPGTNCLQVIATHSLANAERNVLATFCGETYAYDREAEFLASDASSMELHQRWAELRGRMRARLNGSDSSWLARDCDHPRLGKVPGRTALLQAARHAAEHVGEARLMRALIDQDKLARSGHRPAEEVAFLCPANAVQWPA